jgi:hypothetical protein
MVRGKRTRISTAIKLRSLLSEVESLKGIRVDFLTEAIASTSPTQRTSPFLPPSFPKHPLSAQNREVLRTG